MFRRNILQSLPAFLVPNKKAPERRLERLRRQPSSESGVRNCYEVKPLCITVCDYDVEPGDEVKQFCEGKVVAIGNAISPARAGEPVMIVLAVDVNKK